MRLLIVALAVGTIAPDFAPLAADASGAVAYEGSRLDDGLHLITAEWCAHCPAAKAAAADSGVPVRIIEYGPAAQDLWRGCSTPLALPAWVAVVDGKPSRWWIGKGNAEGVRRMAAAAKG